MPFVSNANLTRYVQNSRWLISGYLNSELPVKLQNYIRTNNEMRQVDPLSLIFYTDFMRYNAVRTVTRVPRLLINQNVPMFFFQFGVIFTDWSESV